MTMIRKIVRAEISALGEDEVEVVIATSALARDGHVLVPQGARLDNYRANPIVLWSHDPDKPVGNSTDITVGADKIVARVRFAPIGISAKADEIRGLVKADVIRAVSVGFDPIDGEPLNPSKPKGGQRFTDWELLEFSFVSVPSDVGAVVTARSHGDQDMPEDTTTDAAGASQRLQRATTRAITRAPKIVFQRGLYNVSSLLYLFESLGYQVDQAKFEAAIEGDQSKVPAMLVAVLQDLGDTILAMTAEEIAEALAGHDIEPEEDDDDCALVIEERQHIAAAASPGQRAFRRGMAHAKLRAGKTLSSETIRCLREAKALHEDAIGLSRSALRKHSDGVAAIDEMIERAGAPATEETTATAKSDEGEAEATETDKVDRATTDFQKRQADLAALAAVA